MSARFPRPLRCLWPDCSHVFDEPTGLLELQYLRQHMLFKHHQRMNVEDALKLRIEWEERGARSET